MRRYVLDFEKVAKIILKNGLVYSVLEGSLERVELNVNSYVYEAWVFQSPHVNEFGTKGGGTITILQGEVAGFIGGAVLEDSNP